jgi:beta-mannosidase
MTGSISLNQWQVYVSKPLEFTELEDFNRNSSSLENCQVESLGAFSNLFNNTKLASYVSNHNDFDWWFVCEFDKPAVNSLSNGLITFPPIATIAEVWLNERHILSSQSMFVSNTIAECEFSESNRLVICIRGLSNYLNQKLPRPRWKTKLVKQQTLRWFRTSLLGHIPAWTPKQPIAGILGPITIGTDYQVVNKSIFATVKQSKGVIELTAEIFSRKKSSSLQLIVNHQTFDLEFTQENSTIRIDTTIELDDFKYWWPHTHGSPHCYSITLQIGQGSEIKEIDLGSIGFRQINVDQSSDKFEFVVNDKPVFVRGVCWTISSMDTWHQNESLMLSQLKAVQQSGANMIRVVGTGDYQSDFFYETCSRLGLLVWQDFMFANMDYPVNDPEFYDLIKREVEFQSARIAQFPCLALFCGNSEVEQQVRMLGFSADESSNEFFDQALPTIINEIAGDTAYISSTPTGGAMPFHLNAGPSHYYGIGAYQRPLLEVRRHDVRFAAETLGFANVPHQSTLFELFDGDLPVVHDPRWKLGSPRDSGTGWDFDDIRDFYFKQLFGNDPNEIRYSSPEQYLALSTVTSGEVMSQVFDEWRREKSNNSGGLIWFYKDLVPGAGWGIIDSNNQKKATYYYLKRAWQPIHVSITDELFHGVNINLINETEQSFQGKLKLVALNEFNNPIIDHQMDIELSSNQSIAINADEALDQFFDITNVYRFGPKKIQVFCAILIQDGQELSRAFYYPDKIPLALGTPEITAELEQLTNDRLELSIQSSGFIYAADVQISGYEANDNYFSLLPNRVTKIQLHQVSDVSRIKGFLSAAGLSDDVRLKLSKK